MSKIIKFLITYLVIFLFLFLRFYNLSNSFFFYNDMGRDMMVLKTWQDTGKPPLLGPQTSALPFNQSAIYFYLLYPGFLISKGNPVSLVYTMSAFYLISFIFGLYLLRNNHKLTIVSLIAFFLISIHTQYISQGRYVWNPSFVTPPLIFSIISFYLLLTKYSIKKLLLFSVSIGLAISLSYSVAPILIAFSVYWLIFIRKHILTIALWLSSAIALINLPTIFFELRHHFQLSKALLTRPSPVQEGLTFITKFSKLSGFIFSTPNYNLNIFLFILVIIFCSYLIYKNLKNTKSLSFVISFLFLTITVLSFVTPISVQAHYIFAFTSLLFVLIATLNKYAITIVLIIFSYIYLHPTILSQYFKPSPRTYNQIVNCYKTYCSTLNEPTFVSVQSNFHPFHNGPEHRYLMSQNGCDVKSIETENGSAKYMTVVVDNGSFDENTKYYELDLFGKYKNTSKLNCLTNFQIVTLEKL